MALDKLSGLLRIGSSYNNGASVKSITGSASSWSQDGKTYYHWTGNGSIEVDLLRGFPGKNDRNTTGRKIGDTTGNQAIDYLLCGGGGGGGNTHPNGTNYGGGGGGGGGGNIPGTYPGGNQGGGTGGTGSFYLRLY